ncbi:B-box zinc finger protein 32-like [Mangifera indica]|uniref:B-box zinc finger protein 32-like n=1 Tax=Mangifera indica TaxID=29780 RepID=UPI001CFB03E8|nr:B-box zinc finger protein 32-like [Mangifera indica]
MCRGTQQATGFCFKDEVSVNVNNTASCWISCELCGMRASLYCQADDAYLCRNCDKWVHEANFLARRHVRCFLCNTCQSLTQRYLIGVSLQVLLPTMLVGCSLLPFSLCEGVSSLVTFQEMFCSANSRVVYSCGSSKYSL